MRRIEHIWLLICVLCCLPLAAVAEPVKADNSPMLPNIKWQDTEGKTHHLHDSQGQPRVLHFWAAWCDPCREEMPDLLKWKQANPDIKMIPLSLDQRMAQAKHFIKKYDLPMAPLLLDKKDSAALSIPVLPFTVFVHADGQPVGHHAGIAPWNDPAFRHEVRKRLGLKAAAE